MAWYAPAFESLSAAEEASFFFVSILNKPNGQRLGVLMGIRGVRH